MPVQNFGGTASIQATYKSPIEDEPKVIPFSNEFGNWSM